MALSYEFSIGSIRAKETTMFTNADVAHMLSVNTSDELCRFLRDKGYGEGNNVEEIIENHSQQMWDYLKSVAPDFDIFAPFLYQNDIHNLKAVLKGTMVSRDYNNLLITPNTINTDTMKKAVENRKFSLLPDWLAKPADNAYEVIAHTSDARLCDAILDKAVMDEMLLASQKLNSKFVAEYFKTTIFYNNVKIAIRSARTGVDKDFLEQAICDVEGFPKSAIIDAAAKGNDALLDVLSKCNAYNCNSAIDEYKKSPSAFEKFVDDKLIKLAKEGCKRASEGAEPLMGYLIGSEAEKKVIHIIDCGIRTKSDEEIIKERLREIYG